MMAVLIMWHHGMREEKGEKDVKKKKKLMVAVLEKMGDEMRGRNH